MLIDSHAHIELGNFDGDRDAVLDRARRAGLEAIITVGIDLEDSIKAVALAQSHDMVWAAVGVHPHDAKSVTMSTYDDLRALATEDKVVAYGEIGLDFFKNRSPRDQQIARFGEQLDLCRDLDLPVIIHDRDAHKETVAMLSEHRGNLGGVIHCFSGDYNVARQCLDLGYYISIPGTVTYRNAEVLRGVARKIPLDRIMVETDCPFLSPEPKRGKRNEPAHVAYTAQKIAQIRGMSFDDIARATSDNTRRLFRMPGNDRRSAGP